MAIHSSRQAIFSFNHTEGITLQAGEEVDEVSRGTSSIGVDRVGEVCGRATEGKAAGMYGTGFTAGPLARVQPGMGKGARY